jgi:hypothetical protein
MILMHIAVLAFADAGVGVDQVGSAELSWVDGDLVLKMTCVNRTGNEVQFQDPRNEFDFHRNIPGLFDGLTIKVYSADGTDQTDAVFRPEQPWPRHQWGSAWGSWFEPNQTTVVEVYKLISDFRVVQSQLPQPGWKFSLRYLGYTPEQWKKRFRDADDPELAKAWESGVFSKPGPDDFTVILNTTVVVPPIPARPENANRAKPDPSHRSFWDTPAAPKQ